MAPARERPSDAGAPARTAPPTRLSRRPEQDRGGRPSSSALEAPSPYQPADASAVLGRRVTRFVTRNSVKWWGMRWSAGSAALVVAPGGGRCHDIARPFDPRVVGSSPTGPAG